MSAALILRYISLLNPDGNGPIRAYFTELYVRFYLIAVFKIVPVWGPFGFPYTLNESTVPGYRVLVY